MSEGDAGGSPMALPVDLVMRRERAIGDEPPWLGMVVATLLHVLVLFWIYVDWSHPRSLPPEPEVIPVQVVFAPPPPPPPPATAAPPKPKPPPEPLGYRESGPDQRTSAPPPAEALAPEAAEPPPPAPETAKPEEKTAPEPPEKPSPPDKPAAPAESAKPRPPKEVAHLEPPKKEAETPRAPRLAPSRHLTVTPGERVETGDPYLNQLHDLIERHRLFPRVVGQLGLPVEGTAVYDVGVDRSGKVLYMQLQRSSHIDGIDRAVAEMIRNSLPFPPLPPNYPDEIGITMAIHIFPPS